MNKKNIIYIINFILIGFIILSNKDFILNNNKITLKNMSESTQISDLNKSINELEASHEEYQNYIQTKKIDLATSITNAGVTTSGNDTFETITSNVSKILANKTNDATAVAGEILSGKTAYVKGCKVTGTMTNNGAITASINAGESYSIPAGYHNGSGKITANTEQSSFNIYTSTTTSNWYNTKTSTSSTAKITAPKTGKAKIYCAVVCHNIYFQVKGTLSGFDGQINASIDKGDLDSSYFDEFYIYEVNVVANTEYNLTITGPRSWLYKCYFICYGI